MAIGRSIKKYVDDEEGNAPQLVRTTVWYSIHNCGDGSASLRYFLTKKEADDDQELHNEEGEGWAEHCAGAIETYEGSNIYKRALESRKGNS